MPFFTSAPGLIAVDETDMHENKASGSPGHFAEKKSGQLPTELQGSKAFPVKILGGDLRTRLSKGSQVAKAIPGNSIQIQNAYGRAPGDGPVGRGNKPRHPVLAFPESGEKLKRMQHFARIIH